MSFETRFTELLKIEFSQDRAKTPRRSDFFTLAVKKARSSSKKTRLSIISDMAAALNCADEDLMFLFDDVPLNDNEAQTAFPKFRESYALEAAE